MAVFTTGPNDYATRMEDSRKTPVQIESLPAPVKPVKPTVGETVQADFVANNFLFNYFTKPGQEGDWDRGFNPLQMDKYKGYENTVAEALNEQHADKLVIHQQLRDEAKKTLQEADGLNTFMAGVVSGGLDLDTLLTIPLAPEMFFGKTLLRTGVKSAVVSGAATTAKEFGFQVIEPDRTMEESAMAVAASTGFGAAGGVVMDGITRWASKAAANKILGPNTVVPPAQQTQLAQDIQNVHQPSPSVGAAGIGHTTLEQETIRGGVAMTATNLPGLESPNMALAKSQFAFMRELYQELAVDPFQRNKNFEGITNSIPVETTIEQQFAEVTGNLAIARDDAFKTFKNTTIDGDVLAKEFERLGIQDIDLAAVRANPSKFQNKYNLEILVGGAMRNGDVSPIKEVEQLAKAFRAKKAELGQAALDRGLFDDVIEAAGKKAEQNAVTTHPEAKVKATLESMKSSEEATLKSLRSTAQSATRDADIAATKARLKDIEAKLEVSEKNLQAAVIKAGDDARLNMRNLNSPTSLTYLHRIWNPDAVRANQVGLRKVIAKHVAHLDDPQSAEDDIMASLLGLDRPTTITQMNISAKAGPLKERLLMIPDNELSPWLINNATDIMNKYSRDLITDMAFKDKFGDRTMKSVLDQARLRFDAHTREVMTEMKAAGKSTDEINKKLAELTAAFESDKGHIENVGKIIRGESLDNDKLAGLTSEVRAVKKVVSLSLLGGQLIANLVDLGKMVGTDGVTRFIPAVIHYTRRYFGSPEFKNLTKQQAHDIGIGLESIISNRLSQLGDFMTQEAVVNAGVIGKVNKGLDWTQNWFQKLNGMSSFVTFQQDLGATLNSNRLARLVTGYAKASKNEKAWLAQHFVDEDMAKRIAAEVATHGAKQNGFQFANLGNWKDAEAANVFKSAVWKSTFHSIVTPHAGTLPSWMRSDVGGLVTQFTSFLMASREQFIIAGVGQRDSLAMQSLLGVLFMGAVVAQIKEFIKTTKVGDGQLITPGTFITDEKQWLANTIDASGIGALPLYGALLTEITNRSLGVDDNKRFRNIPDLATRFAGPTYGYAEKAWTIANDVLNGDGIKDSSIHKARQMIPFQNLFYFRQLFDKIEDQMKEAFGGGR